MGAVDVRCYEDGLGTQGDLMGTVGWGGTEDSVRGALANHRAGGRILKMTSSKCNLLGRSTKWY